MIKVWYFVQGGFLIKKLGLNKFPFDLLITLIWTMLALAFILIPALSETFVRTVLGIPMVLFIPGYVLIAALFPKAGDLGGLERTALGFGLSIAVAPLLGLLLNFTFGITFLPLLLSLCLYTIALIAIAAYRRGKLPEEERLSIPFHRAYEIISNEFSTSNSVTDRVLTGILIFSIALSIGAIYFVIATPKTGERFTEFYILGPEGKAADYAANLKHNSPATILVGVVNHEYAPVNYTVQVALDRETLNKTWLRLDNNETWEKNITFVPGKKGKDLKLEFWLFKDDNFTAPYRELHLWVNT